MTTILTTVIAIPLAILVTTLVILVILVMTLVTLVMALAILATLATSIPLLILVAALGLKGRRVIPDSLGKKATLVLLDHKA